MIPFKSGGSFNPPWSADAISAINSSYNPSSVRVDSYTLNYFRRDLMQRLTYFVKWNNMPEHWDKDYVNFALVGGYCGVIDAGEDFGIVPQWGTLSGWGIYCQPTRLSVLNRFFQKPMLLIGRDCEILRLTPDWCGLWDIIDFYAVKLAYVSRDFDMSAMQSVVSWAVAAKNKAAAVTIKAIYDKAQSGEPLIVYDKSALLPNDGENEQPWQEFSRDVHDSLIFSECLDAMQQLYHQFDTVVGIPYASTAKKERTLTIEAEATAGETQSRIQGFIDTLSRSCDRVNKMFGLDLSVSIRGGGPGAPNLDT